MSSPLEGEVVVACLPDRNNDTRDQVIFIGVIASLGDVTVYF
jgi:hypothetical protein